MQLEAALTGNLVEYMKEQAQAAATAVTLGVTDIANGVKADLRAQVLSAGLGQKVANAWRADVFPKGKKSINAAAWVKTKAPEIIIAFNDGTVIKSNKGLFLAIPTSAAPKRGTDSKRINPSNFPEGSLGKLRFVYRTGRPSLLVVDDLRASTGKKGGFLRASDSALAKGRGITTVVMFIMVPQVSMRKRLDIDAVAEKWENALADRIMANWPEEKGE